MELLCNSAMSQDAKAGSGGLEIAEVSGELEALSSSPYGLKIKPEKGESYVAVLATQTALQYRGTADKQFLQPGLLVRFVAPFYPQTLIPQAPVTAIEVFRAEHKRRPSREELLAQTPGIHPVPEMEGSKKQDDTLKTAPAGMKNYQVVGQIRAVQDDRLQVQAGGQFLVMAQLDPAVVITVASGDTFFCVPGDKVEVTGLRNPAQNTLIQAERVEITGAKSLGTPPPEERQQPEKPSRRSRLNRGKR